MTKILSLSVAAQKLNGIVQYYSHQLGNDNVDWDEAKSHLKDDLYHEMEQIAEQGRSYAEEDDSP